MAKLINYQYLRYEADLSQNIPDSELDNPIKRSEEMLSMVIGEDLYNELVSENPNFSASNTALMLHVKKFLAWQAAQFWYPKANLKTHASGLRVHHEDNSEPASEQQIANLVRDSKMWCQTQKEKLIQFLEDNESTYPLYDATCGKKSRSGTGFHITSVGGKKKTCDGCS